MQESTTQERSADARGGPLSPGKAFVIALLLLAAALTGWMLSRPDAPTPPSTTNNEPTEPNYTLTNEEAIARFEELRTVALRVTRERDASLIPLAFTSDGPTARQAQSEIQRLTRDAVLDRTKVQTIDTDVLSSTASSIRISETSVLYPCFRSEKGKDVTTDHSPIRQTATWILQPENGEWLIHDAILEKSRVVRGHARAC